MTSKAGETKTSSSMLTAWAGRPGKKEGLGQAAAPEVKSVPLEGGRSGGGLTGARAAEAVVLLRRREGVQA
jgi:hypothetical protein